MTKPDFTTAAYRLCGRRAPTLTPEVADALRGAYEQGRKDERKRLSKRATATPKTKPRT